MLNAVWWVIDAAEGSVWRNVSSDELPDFLSISVKVAPTAAGVAPVAVQVERTDGRPLIARNLRLVKFPPPWVLRGDAPRRWYKSEGRPVTAARRGPKAPPDQRHRMVWDLWLEAQQVAPRSAIRFMMRALGTSESTARRWVHAARDRAAELGWDAEPQQGPHFPRYDGQPPAESSAGEPGDS